MAETSTRQATLAKIKTDLRISHSALDGDLDDQISACLADLEICGIEDPDETDTTVLAIIKLYCRAAYTDDTGKAESYQARYDKLKSCLMMAEGYGGAAVAN